MKGTTAVILVLAWLLGGVVKGNQAIAEQTEEIQPCVATQTPCR